MSASFRAYAGIVWLESADALMSVLELHRHSGIALPMPEDIHRSRADAAATRDMAFCIPPSTNNPERFAGVPNRRRSRSVAFINRSDSIQAA